MRGEDFVGEVELCVEEGSPPHARGRPMSKFGICAVICGSPPHARGRRRAAHAKKAGKRITPACAGKTPVQSTVLSNNWDHPRMRGEDVKFVDSLKKLPGSPPHARGRRLRLCARRRRRGITPACAGKTRCEALLGERISDHPRMRGEDRMPTRGGLAGIGSPPHARGRRCALEPSPGDDGDHPRMRGEDFCRSPNQGIPQGSPPHARGRLLGKFALGFMSRITPACAGKTSSLASP